MHIHGLGQFKINSILPPLWTVGGHTQWKHETQYRKPWPDGGLEIRTILLWGSSGNPCAAMLPKQHVKHPAFICEWNLFNLCTKGHVTPWSKMIPGCFIHWLYSQWFHSVTGDHPDWTSSLTFLVKCNIQVFLFFYMHGYGLTNMCHRVIKSSDDPLSVSWGSQQAACWVYFDIIRLF